MKAGWRKEREEDLDRELRSDLKMEAEEQQTRGLAPAEARYAANRAIGNASWIKEEVREMWGWAWLDRWRQDASYAARTFMRARAFSTVVILTLALGIGATTAMFSIVEAVLLNPLPFRNSARLVTIWEKFAGDPNAPPFADSYRDFEIWKTGSQSFDELTPVNWNSGRQILTGRGASRQVFATLVGVDFFRILGMPPELGRTFQPDDLASTCAVVLKHSFWVEAFAGQKDAIGSHIQLNETACKVVGVMPLEFVFYPDAAAMWMLITPDSSVARNPNAPVLALGRLKDGVSIARAQEEVDTLFRNSPRTNIGGIQVRAAVYPLAEQFARLTGPTLRVTVMVLFVAVAFVLLIGCLNVANLLLGRSVVRRKEFAVRAALGSARARLAGQLLTEALLLSLSGAILGVWVAVGAVHYFRAANPIALPPGNPVRVNLPVLAFAASLAVLTALLFGLAPALKASRIELMDALRVTAQASYLGRTARALRRVLVVAEVALSLALLTGAGLLIQSVERFASVRLGFQTNRVMTLSVTLPRWGYTTADQRARFYRAVLDRTKAVPGFPSVALSSSVPPDERFPNNALAVAGRPEPNITPAALDICQASISPDYFRVMGVPLKVGRGFESADREGAPAVAIVNEALVRKYFPDQNPIGGRIKVLSGPPADRPWLTIVGVVGDERDQNFFAPMNWEELPTVFRPLNQDPAPRASLVFQQRMSGTGSAAAIRKEISALDNNVPIGEVQTMKERLAKTLSYPRLRAIVLAAFAGFAVLLAAIGLYGVLSQSIAQRTQELGIRMALGAQRSDLLKLVAREGMTLTLAGVAGGLMIAVFLTGFLNGLLYGVKAADPWTFAGVSLLLVVVALVATYVPARRASRVDPMAALRYE